jgi:hypothetical protein
VLPLLCVGSLVSGQFTESLLDLVERQPNLLSYSYECEPSQHVTTKVSLVSFRAIGVDQSFLFIEANRGRGESAATGYFTYGEQDIVHGFATFSKNDLT